jgi:hypothetical protein
MSNHPHNFIYNSDLNITYSTQLIQSKRRHFQSLNCTNELLKMSQYCASISDECKKYNEYIKLADSLATLPPLPPLHLPPPGQKKRNNYPQQKKKIIKWKPNALSPFTRGKKITKSHITEHMGRVQTARF